MITDFIINLFIKIPYALLSSLPDFSISFDTSYFEKFKSYVSFVGYVLPLVFFPKREKFAKRDANLEKGDSCEVRGGASFTHKRF